jgi:PAS domain S-box-containing protein
MEQINHNTPIPNEVELLAEVSQLLTDVDLDEVMQKVVTLSGRVAGASRTSLFLHERHRINWERLITIRPLTRDESVQVVSRVLDEGFAGWVVRHKQGAIIDDTKQDDRWIIFEDDTFDARSALCVPFLLEGEVIAVLTLVHEEPQHFQPYHLRLLEIIANQAAIAIRNAQLFNNLDEQKMRLQAILQSIGETMLVLDRQGNIEMANTSALALLGADSSSDVIGKQLEVFAVHEDALHPIIEIIKADLTQHQDWKFEARSDRRQMDYQVSMSVWRDPKERRTGYVVVMHNITELRDLSRFKDEMLQVVSHDLRSPLALIAGYADMVKLDTPDESSPVHDYVEAIRSAIERMSNLIEDLLRVERIRQSPLELHESTDIAALVKVVIVNMRPAAETKQLRFHSDLQLQHIPRIVADPVLIRQSMENLINNAIKYTDTGGEVLVHSYYDADHFYFEVTDTGLGIPAEHLNYVFEAFYRVESMKVAQKGSGLGLSLVKNVIARHNGETWVKSEVGKGSTFGFKLPLHPSAEIEGYSSQHA